MRVPHFTSEKYFLHLSIKTSLSAYFLMLIVGCSSPPKESKHVRYYGALKQMMHKGDISKKVSLKEFEGKKHVYGLGATKNLKGEILIMDGQPMISFVKNGKMSIDTSFNHDATLYVHSEVSSWQEMPLPNSVQNADQFHEFLTSIAPKHQLPKEGPFPFLLSGDLDQVDWHVINWKEGDMEHSHDKHINSGLRGRETSVEVEILGFYSQNHKGIFTHHTSDTHMHVWIPGSQIMGHVDDIHFGKNMMLSIPRFDELSAQSNVQVTEQDLPVDPGYVQQIAAIDSVKVHYASKWFNAISITADSTLLPQILDLPFVLDLQAVRSFREEVDRQILITKNQGKSSAQLEQIGLEAAHFLGHSGDGVHIGVFDSGFTLADALPVFQPIWSEGRVISAVDLYDGDGWVFHHHHGTYVWSILAGDADELTGASPDADYSLFRTEVTGLERRLEEDNWVVAAEKADSMGVEIINSSLGYSSFDVPDQSYSPMDMDGETTRISRAAQIATEKGILVVSSAGNSGNSDWRIITAPADARDVLSVGAVDADGQHASFSSHGPTADGRIKPEVCATGFKTTFAHTDGSYPQGNGTSFSAPLISGLAACLMEAKPEASAMEVRQAIIESAHLYANPNDSMGFGIPHFLEAFAILSKNEQTSSGSLSIYPNPSNGKVTLELDIKKTTTESPRILDASGRLISEALFFCEPSGRAFSVISTQDMAPGVYYVEWSGKVERLVVR